MTVTIIGMLLQARVTLTRGGVEEAPLESELLLGFALGMERSVLYASLEEVVPESAQQAMESLVQRRLLREPLAYILGKKEFFGLEFKVCPGVFIPRPETETLVEQAVLLVNARFPGGELLIADIGTGSGALAVSLAKALPSTKLYATDISETALATARANAAAHGVQDRTSFLRGNLMEPLPEPVDVVVANLPYIESRTIPCLQPEVSQFEPREALDGGPDGLDVVYQLLRQGTRHIRANGAILLELDPEQMEAASNVAREVYPEARLQRVNDLWGRERVLVIRCNANS
ncbi:MAG: peptide chain release factor N(5)-glutamine methyltransferase [Dehalococcoidia bacterium]|nr:peptide chain release factor N(5)-glutamine methyltransferase [Dehalococcoidia bacterium]